MSIATPLSPSQLAALRALLMQRREALRSQLAAHRHGQTAADHAHDVLTQDGDDAAQRLPERDIAAALTALEERELNLIDTALLRMDDGSYGVCVDCGVDIAYERLTVEPWAVRCIACATAAEKRG
ncbi:MAG: TraR/DksA family transcriptional regulator [Proteobacteria bacterium]|nr:TraR/DksA family transcriptional regulator [Pseudomonadota bacterium]